MTDQITSSTGEGTPQTEPASAVFEESQTNLLELLADGRWDRTGRQADVTVVTEELRRRNLPIVYWTAIVFNPLYLLWACFDWVLVPENWAALFALRWAAVILVAVAAGLVFRFRDRTWSFEGFWVVAGLYSVFIVVMLPFAADALLPYVMGLSITILGAGILPVWPPRWAVSLVAVLVFVAVLVVVLSPVLSQIDRESAVTCVFVLSTSSGLSVAASVFKFRLARNDIVTRRQLADLARKERDARKRLAETSSELHEALEKLTSVDRMKSEFFANISHELRTPLTLIVAPVTQIVHATTEPRVKQLLSTVLSNAERLLCLINDLLDLARADAGGLRLNLDMVNIRSVVETVVENSRPAAQAKNIELVDWNDGSSQLIWADAHRLEIVVTNLVSNAVKFTPESGSIRVETRDRVDAVEVSVRDTGPGIPEDVRDRVFERFFNVGYGERRREEGVGIGLALAKELVELHGGVIGATSEAGDGSCFTFSIPFGKDHIRPEAIERRRRFQPERIPGVEQRSAEDDVRPATESAPVDNAQESAALMVGGRRPRILLAEDNDQLREFIAALLAPMADVTEAEDGAEALAILRADLHDLVLSDVMMPKLEGTDLCREIKLDPVLKHTPVVLLTARVGSEATLEAYAHGADDFVAKPFHPQVLLARIKAQLRLQSMAFQLVETEKLSTVGLLAAGVIHEVRNPLNGIMNSARVLASKGTPTETSRRLLEVILDGAQRIQDVTDALNAHARPAEFGGSGLTHVRSCFESTLRLLQHRMDGITVDLDVSAEARVGIQDVSFNQVILNLLDNAVSMGARRIWISEDRKGESLQLAIADDGAGIPLQWIDRVFDPFFTRRSDDSGSGLGLYVSREIVRTARGELSCSNRPGGGAVFCIKLPLAGYQSDHGGNDER